MLVDEDTGVDLLLERWHKATPLQKKQGRTWYLSAHDYAFGLSYKYGHSLRTTAGVIAALSPGNKWENNRKDAELALEVDSRKREVTFWNKVKFRNKRPELSALLDILNGVDPDTTLGLEAKSFYRCIYNPMTDEVRVDSWSATALNYGASLVKREDYPVLQSYYVYAAETTGTLPPIMQATVWIQIRGKHE